MDEDDQGSVEYPLRLHAAGSPGSPSCAESTLVGNLGRRGRGAQGPVKTSWLSSVGSTPSRFDEDRGVESRCGFYEA